MPDITVDPQPDPLVSPQPVPINQSSHNFSKSILIGILIFVLLSVTAYGAYWYGQSVPMTKIPKSNSFPTEKVSSFSNISTPKPASVPAEETAGWVIYTAQKHPISFKYPSDWVANIKLSPQYDNEEMIILQPKSVTPTDFSQIEIIITNNRSMSIPSIKTPNYIVDNLPAFRETHPGTTQIPPGIQVEFSKENIYVVVQNDNAGVLNTRIFDQILSTLKFLP